MPLPTEHSEERWTPERQGVVSMAPFVPTPSLGVSAALRLLAMSPEREDVFIDLGCGDGRLVAAAYAQLVVCCPQATASRKLQH